MQDFLYGGMENTTATVFADFFLVDRRAFLDRNYIGVNVHELTHQWFGDYITGRSGRQSWLQESFATFYAKLFLKEIRGDDAYQWERRREQDGGKIEYRAIHSPAAGNRMSPTVHQNRIFTPSCIPGADRTEPIPKGPPLLT